MSDLMKSLIDFTGSVSDWMYSNILFWALIVAGIFFTIRTKFVQLRLFPEGIRILTEKSHEGGISSFQALMIATASEWEPEISQVLRRLSLPAVPGLFSGCG